MRGIFSRTFCFFRVVEGLVPVLLFAFLVACNDDGGNPVAHPNADESSSSESSLLSNSSSSVLDESEVSSSSSATETVVDPSTVIKGTMTDSRDGHTYKTVTIGTQTWMAENLNFETANSFCYNDSLENCAIYGRLYTWGAAMDSAAVWSTDGKDCGYKKNCSTYPPALKTRGICPEGWLLPDEWAWEQLYKAIGRDRYAAADILKSASGWRDDGNGTDDYSFAMLPSGIWVEGADSSYSEFESLGAKAYFWLPSAQSLYVADLVMVQTQSPRMFTNFVSKNSALAVRCIKAE